MKKLIIALLILFLTGCGTIFSKSGDDGKYWGNAYTGVRCSAQMTGVTLSNTTTLILFPLALVDMVISTVADTVLLPVDLAIKPVTNNVNNPCNLKSE